MASGAAKLRQERGLLDAVFVWEVGMSMGHLFLGSGFSFTSPLSVSAILPLVPALFDVSLGSACYCGPVQNTEIVFCVKNKLASLSTITLVLFWMARI